MDPIVIVTNETALEKMKKFYDSQMIDSNESNIIFSAKTVGCHIVCYENLQVEFAGNNALIEASRWEKIDHPNKDTDQEGLFLQSHIGAAEVGSGDYFGPMCIVACYVDERDIDWLKSIDIHHPQSLTDQEIVAKAKAIKDRMIYSLLLLDNAHYNNAISHGTNQATLKAQLHNQAITNVMQKLQQPIETKVIEQFVSSKTYFNYLKNEVVVVKDLIFEENAQLKYLAVGCSYILAKYAYLQYYTNMCKSLKIKLPRGTGANVDVIGAQIIKNYGERMLVKVGKLHLTNTKRMKELVNKE
ncbi:MAG: ribonuclease HIII [Beduini sp.]|uniref:ribonuclease HIII n=1 Tax=Beduini sp. TaxID=1922300 RepID=UPI0011C9F3EB